jgi:hypothetical protein
MGERVHDEGTGLAEFVPGKDRVGVTTAASKSITKGEGTGSDERSGTWLCCITCLSFSHVCMREGESCSPACDGERVVDWRT